MAAVASMATMAAFQVRADLVRSAHWAFENNTDDSSNNGNAGTASSGVDFIDGRWGRAAWLNTGTYVYNTTAANMPDQGGDSWSMNVWLNLANAPALLSDLAQFGVRDPGAFSGQSRGLIQFDGNGGPGLYFWGNSADLYSGTSYHADGQWHMYTITYAGDVQQLSIYRDAQMVNSGTIALADITCIRDGETVPSTSPYLLVGGTSPWNPTQGWEGAVDEFSVWRGTLSAEQVGNLFTSNAVPEPCSLMLSTLALLGLLAHAWRKRT